MTWHPTNTEAALGFALLAVGGILLIWACLRSKTGVKPQPKDEPLHQETHRVERPIEPISAAKITGATNEELAHRGDLFASRAVLDRSKSAPKRGKNGRFEANPLTKSRKRVSAKRPTSASR